MKQSKLIKDKFSKYLNKAELYYREKIQPNEKEYNNKKKWIQRINDGRQEIMPFLSKEVNFSGQILELGAGSCWVSSIISQRKSVSHIWCLDSSEFILKNIAPYIMRYLKADSKKITRVVGDFNKLNFENEKFDYVIFDGALHHIPIDCYNRVLKEVYRVLKKNGKLIAIREPFLDSFHISRKVFGLHEKKYGVTENIFTKEEWGNILGMAQFNCSFVWCPFLFIDNSFNIKNMIKKIIKYSPLKILYYIFFPKYLIICKKNV